jgi:anti-anti-sigma factor
MESKYAVPVKRCKIELAAGRSTNAPSLQEELKKLVGQQVKDLVFYAQDLEYISSAGLRVLIFAKQKIGVDAHAYLVGAGEGVLSVIKMSGLDNFMTIQSAY